MMALWKNFFKRNALTLIMAIAGALLAYLALITLRFELLNELNLTWQQALQGEINYGTQYDMAILLSGWTVCLALYVLFGLAPKVPVIIINWVIYIPNLSNLLFFKYFGMRLEWDLVKEHIVDLPSVADSAVALSLNVATILSIITMLASSVLIALCPKWHSWPPHHFTKRWQDILLFSRLPMLFITVLSLLTSLGLWNFWVDTQRTGLLSSQIIKIWVDQICGYQVFANKSAATFVLAKNTKPPLEKPAEILADYRKLLEKSPYKSSENYADGFSDYPLEPELISAGDPAWPLLSTLEKDDNFSQKMRENLGLPATGKPNVIMLFVESFRAYEFLHPEFGPFTFPQTKELLAKHGIFFPKTYSSSWASGQTARGQFSTECSIMPNNQGQPTYVAYTALSILCLPEFLRQNGYETVWTATISSSFHTMGLWASLHGYNKFYDGDYFEGKVPPIEPGWGKEDYGYLEESVKLLESIAKEGKPIYANLQTLSTHHPHSIMPGYEIPDYLKEKYKMNDEYEKFFSRWRYEDAALGNFFNKLFASELGDNTIVIMVGDHASPGRSGDKVPILALQERHSRIVLALVTKNMKKPAEIPWPVHQIDIAPTVAHIIGLSGKVSWLGRGLFARPGSPWIYSFGGGRQQFVLGERHCYKLPGRENCFDVKEGDPLFAKKPTPQSFNEKDEKMLDYVDTFYRANLEAIAGNKIYPYQARQY